MEYTGGQMTLSSNGSEVSGRTVQGRTTVTGSPVNNIVYLAVNGTLSVFRAVGQGDGTVFGAVLDITYIST
jgi:hypothetical protein